MFLSPNDIPSFKNYKLKIYVAYGDDYGYFSTDNLANIFQNQLSFSKEASIPIPIVMKQVHSSEIVQVKKGEYSKAFTPADGIWTEDYNTAIATLTADCIALILACENSIFSLHCGWRGINQGIIDNAINLIKEREESVKYAFIAPHICEKCYEVKEDLISAIDNRHNLNEIIKESGGKTFLSMKDFAISSLKLNGVEQSIVEVSPLCSSCDNRFFSFRRDKGKTGRMMTSVIKERL